MDVARVAAGAVDAQINLLSFEVMMHAMMTNSKLYRDVDGIRAKIHRERTCTSSRHNHFPDKAQ